MNIKNKIKQGADLVCGIVTIVTLCSVFAVCGHFAVNDILYHLTGVNIDDAESIVEMLYVISHLSYFTLWAVSLLVSLLFYVDIWADRNYQ